MEFKTFIKEKYKILIFITLIAIALSAIFLKDLGLKDAAVFFIGTVMLFLEIYLIFLDKKKSLLLFIISFPIIVTARKVCNFDFLFLRITYETIYITFFFLINYKNVSSKIKELLKNGKSKEFKFIMQIFIFSIFAVVSCIFSVITLHSMSEVFISVFVPFFFMICILITFTKEDLSNIIFSLVISIDLSCIYGFSQMFSNHIPLRAIGANTDLLTFGYHNVNIFASILIIISPFMLQQILYRKNSNKAKVFLFISLGINLLALFLTHTRGAWLTFVAVAFLILISKKYRKIMYIFIAGGVLVAKPVLTYILSRGTTTSIFVDESAIARVQSIFTCVKMMILYPFGVGPGNFAAMYKRYAEAGYLLMPQSMRIKINMPNYVLENAHNLWLQIGVEYGLVCLIVFMIIIINRLIVAFSNYKENRATIIAIVSYFIMSVTSGVEFNHKGVITGNLILWLVFAMIELNKSKTTLPDRE